MNILIIDDSENIRLLLKYILESAGYEAIYHVKSAFEAFQLMGINNPSHTKIIFDLILMDISLPEMDGIEACRRIKAEEKLKDVPVIMVTGRTDDINLQLAFEAGAIDYITKPVNKIEILARVHSALKLKQEMDRRKEITRQLKESNRKLQLLSSLDSLTKIANRRQFNKEFEKEWKLACRNEKPLTLILLDIDYFKNFNDTYGHQAGDECLQKIAKTLRSMIHRAGDLVARYGGEEFVIVLPFTSSKDAEKIAQNICAAIESLAIPHIDSEISNYVTCSIGVASVIPNKNIPAERLLKAVDLALYKAKHNGRNRVEAAKEI